MGKENYRKDYQIQDIDLLSAYYAGNVIMLGVVEMVQG